jgi:hypothetical protein
VAIPQRDGRTAVIQASLICRDLCRKYQIARKIIAGGPVGSTIGLTLIVEAGSAVELDQTVTSLPIWSRTHVTATLTTPAGCAEVLQPARQHLSALVAG